MDFRVLGPVEVLDDGSPVPLGRGKPRLLLAALLVEPGRIVSAERLITIVWGEDPPETARALIHTYVSALRRSLNRRREVITTRPPGYLIQIGPDELDRQRFDRLVADARTAAGEGRLAVAVEAYRAAEALWLGPAYGGLGDSALAVEAARLDELRLVAISERIQAELDLGRGDHLVVELTALVGAHPTHERLRGHLMAVLYRLGRQADALATYREAREVLVEQLGIEPGPHLRAVHDAILRNDPDLVVPDLVPGGADEATRGLWPRPFPSESAPPVPAQLPLALHDFTGRAAEAAALVEALGPAAPAGPRTCVISGPGGAGKSSLAVRVAHELAPAFPDGQLYAELRGTTQAPLEAGQVLGRFLRALGADPSTLPESTDERAERYRTLLAGRRVLVVLDDAASERQVRPLLPGGPGCAVLVTARRRLPGLDGARLTELGMLAPAEAAELLARVTGRERVEAEPEAAARIAELCGCLPLAVRIVGARLASRRHWSLGRMAGRLTDENRRLDELSVSDQQVRAGIEVSYRGLSGEAQLALRHLGALGLPDFPGWLVALLLGAGDDVADRVIEQLVDAHLLDYGRTDPAGQLRYRLHELVRLYGHERGAADDPPAVRAAAVRRVVECWLWLVDQISQSAPTGAIPLNPPTRALPEPPAGIAKPILANPRAWLDAEQAALVIGVERAAALDLVDVSVALATALCGTVFAVGNLFEAWGRTHEAALAAARRAGDRAAEATLLLQIGQLRCDQDRYAESHEFLTEALGIMREIGDERGEATVRAALGTTCREQGHLRESMYFLGQAQRWFRSAAAAGDAMVDPALGYVNRLTGTTRLEQGDVAGAEEDLRESVAAYRRFACRRGEALALRSLSQVHRARGDLAPAERLSREALAIFRAIGDELLTGYGLQALAKTRIRQGFPAEADAPLAEALVTLRRLGDRWGEAFVLRTRGEMHLAAGRLAQASADLTEAIARWEALDVPLNRARSQRDLARVRLAQGQPQAAAALRAAALAVFVAYGAREATELSSESTGGLQGTR